jgi:hypothetical protein
VPGKLRSRLIWRDARPEAPEKGASLLHSLAVISGRPETNEEKPDLNFPAAPRERAIAFLHIGSEIEHALMVQYLYAGFSLNEEQDDEKKCSLVKSWKAAVVEIAREEMGHLATVQNMLTVIGGPLCFERDDYPIIDADLWPFPFELEPLTKRSLGKYVLAEMPSEDVLNKLGLTAEIDEIKRRLQTAEVSPVHRVGRIYEEILRLFTEGPMIQGPIVPDVTDPHPFVATVDFQADSIRFQVTPGAWGLGYKNILIESAIDRKSALLALTQVSVQGEGPLDVNDQHLSEQFNKSHCARFLNIYRDFPEPQDWQPARPVATNPTTNPEVVDPARHIEGAAASWAALLNLRYRMLLLYLKHSFYIEAPAVGSQHSPRAALVSWAFGEMYNLRTLSEVLMNLPLNPHSSSMAGPPFDMPYTLSLPSRSADRWRSHRDLLLASTELVEEMLASGSVQEQYLSGLRASDQTALEQVVTLIGA